MALILVAICILFLIWTQRDRKWTCVFLCFVLFFISASKSVLSNEDLQVYQAGYYLRKDKSFQDLFSSYISGEMKDFGYNATAKIFALLGFSFEFWTICIALFFAIAVALYLYRDSKDIFISASVLFTFYYAFTFSGLRQTIAIGIILFAYRYLKEKRLKPYCLLVFIAFLFHSSALIFLPAYFLARMKIGVKQIALVLIGLAICVFTPSIVRSLLKLVAWNDTIDSYVEREVALTWSGYIIQFLMVAFCWFFRQKQKGDTSSNESAMWLNLIIIGLCIRGASTIIAEAFRANYYYGMAFMLALPDVIQSQKKKEDRKLMYALVSLCLIAYMIYTNSYANVIFFWQA